MAFKIEAFQNKFLPPGKRRVDAIVTVTADQEAQSRPAGRMVIGFIVDKSGSMSVDRIDAVKRAVETAVGMLPPRARFFVVAFDSVAQVVVPETEATPDDRLLAHRAVDALRAGGGTAMSTGLAAARALFERTPNAIRQAIFLTDGKNESESAGNVTAQLQACEGLFQCDCWGVGTDWRVGEVQQIAHALLGKASLVPEASGIEGAFRAAIEKASGKALKDVRLRLWTPVGATLSFVKQANPLLEDLTPRGRQVAPQVREYMTGAWGPGEARDFHVAIDVREGAVGEEMLAARPSVVWLEPEGDVWVERETKPAAARVFATWTADDALSSRIDGHVAHYTGQGELAVAIQKGLDLRVHGDEAAATQMLGRAVKIAHESGNAEMTQRLARVVEVVDAGAGTVRLKRDVSKAAAMDLELESRTTKRAKKAPPPAGGA
ncbi:MAG: VWA domain-containing protein [Polyangiaceae bacterium]